MKINVSLIIPCYNEAKNLPFLINRCEKLIEEFPMEVILVDNGSTDNSEKIIAKHSVIKLVRVEKNEGYGNGILKGLRNANGEILAWTHADLQTDPNDMIKGLKCFLNTDDHKTIFVKGKRYGRPIVDLFFTLGMSIFETIFLRKFLWDINAQPTIFHKSFFEQWRQPPKDFSLDLYAYFMAKKLELTIKRFPVQFSNRLHGESSWNVNLKGRYQFIRRTLIYSYKLKRELKRI
tara:strand:+ start:89 stop:790 length:702 start_codon:yes stop_codon:yes gene_type:complete